MSKELQSIQTLRSDFINHFSHEFKTPITAITGFARAPAGAGHHPRRSVNSISRSFAEESHRLADLANSTLLIVPAGVPAVHC
ncbi:MAG: histidine kinase dimerization/phospho-acceptor domain-containing protein [Lawsonibacter sp.]